MLWDTWALLSIIGLCLTVIVWAAWGFYQETRDARSVRILLASGGYLTVPIASGRRMGRMYRGQHRGQFQESLS